MARIDTFLASLANKKNGIVLSKTTSSKYYIVGNLKIGIGDHLPDSNTATDIRIAIPLNSKTLYMVRIKEGLTILTFTFAELKCFIQNYIYINQIKKISSVVKAETLDINYNSTLDWTRTAGLVSKKVKGWRKISKVKRTVIKSFSNGKTVREVIDFVIKADELGLLRPTSSQNKLKEFLESL